MQEPMPSADTPRVPAVDRAVRLIDTLAASHEPLALAELARRLALPKSSVHGLLATLVAHGLAPRGTPFQLNQGRFLQRPSRLQVCVGNDDSVRVGGYVQLLARAELLIDPASL